MGQVSHLTKRPPLGRQAYLNSCYRCRQNNYFLIETLYFSFPKFSPLNEPPRIIWCPVVSPYPSERSHTKWYKFSLSLSSFFWVIFRIFWAFFLFYSSLISLSVAALHTSLSGLAVLPSPLPSPLPGSC